jgi:hypothetical protein
VDETHNLLSDKMATMRSERAGMQKQLDEQMALLRAATEKRIEFTEGQSTWVGYVAISHVPRQLNNLVTSTLEDAMAIQDILQVMEEEEASLQRQLEFLEAGAKDV